MATDDIARLAYLALLGVAVGGWFIAESRRDLGQTARQAIIWGLIFIGVIAAAGLWSDIRDDVMPGQSVADGVIEVPRSPDGHYYLVLELDGTPVTFMVDTGASDVVLSLKDARRVGLNPDELVFSGQANTANGAVQTARARIGEIRLGGIVDRGLRVSVNGGEMDESLLGMSYLQRFKGLKIKGNRLILER